MKTLRRNDERARFAIAFIIFVLLMNVIGIFSSYLQLNLLAKASKGIVTMQEVNANDRRELIVLVVYGIVLLIAGILYIQWFRRAYFNLHLRVSKLSTTEGWAAGGWFVPILNFFKPYEIMQDLFLETKKFLDKHGKGAGINLSMTVVGIWWGLWVLVGIADRVIAQMTKSARSIEDLVSYTKMDMVVSVGWIVTGVFAIIVVTRYAQAELVLRSIQVEPIPETEATRMENSDAADSLKEEKLGDSDANNPTEEIN